MLDEALKPFLARSAMAHAALVAALGLAFAKGAARRPQVYTIQFVGAAPAIVNRSPSAAAAPAAPSAPARVERKPPPPQTDPDAFGKPGRKPLPRPSFVSAATPTAKEPPPPQAPAVRPSPEGAAAPAGGSEDGVPGAPPGPDSQLATDFGDFPYPWYITKVRTDLWLQWSRVAGSGSGEIELSFNILRDGKLVDLRVLGTSGDSALDYAALSAVREAGPFAPLPAKFAEPFLKIRVQLRTNR